MSESTEAVPVDDTLGGLPLGVPRAAALRLGTAWGVVLTAGGLGIAFMPWLLVNAPLLLIALSPLPRHLLFVVEKVDLLPFVIVAALRREAVSMLWYFMGVTYGERGIRWFEGRYTRAGRVVRAGERLFRTASLPLLFISPNPLFCLLAGAWGVRAAFVLPLTLCGHALWISLTYLIGEAFADVITPITRWISAHMLELTLASVLLVVGGRLLRQLRNKRNLHLG